MGDDAGLALKRSFQILEIFHEQKRPLKATDLQRIMACPKSSLMLVLKGMVTLGYLNHDGTSRTYFPSVRLQQVSEWIVEAITRGPALRRAAVELRDKVNETVVISAKSHDDMEVAIVEASHRPIMLQLPVGSRLRLWSTAVGCAYLMQKRDSEVRQMYAARLRDDPAIPPLDDVLARVRAARSAGFAMSIGTAIPDLAALACPLTVREHQLALVLSVGGPIRRVRENWRFLADRLVETARKCSAA